MHVQICGAGVGQQLLDAGDELASIHQLPPEHQRVGIERAHRERAQAQLLGHLVHGTGLAA